MVNGLKLGSNRLQPSLRVGCSRFYEVEVGDMVLRSWRLFFGGLLIALLTGCSQHYEEGSHPPPKPPPVIALPEGHPPIEGGRPAGRGGASKAAGTVSGTIRLAPELAARVPGNAYLYIIARERADGGPPYAFKRLRVPEFPYQYTLTQDDVAGMFGEGIVLAEIPEMYLVAKVDRDGMVGRQPGDMEGVCPKNPVAAGEHSGDILIDQVY